MRRFSIKIKIGTIEKKRLSARSSGSCFSHQRLIDTTWVIRRRLRLRHSRSSWFSSPFLHHVPCLSSIRGRKSAFADKLQQHQRQQSMTILHFDWSSEVNLNISSSIDIKRDWVIDQLVFPLLLTDVFQILSHLINNEWCFCSVGNFSSFLLIFWLSINNDQNNWKTFSEHAKNPAYVLIRSVDCNQDWIVLIYQWYSIIS